MKTPWCEAGHEVFDSSCEYCVNDILVAYNKAVRESQQMFALADLLPASFYADRELGFRIKRMVENWQFMVTRCQELDDKLKELGR